MCSVKRISGLVVEYIVAIDVTRVRSRLMHLYFPVRDDRLLFRIRILRVDDCTIQSGDGTNDRLFTCVNTMPTGEVGGMLKPKCHIYIQIYSEHTVTNCVCQALSRKL